MSKIFPILYKRSVNGKVTQWQVEVNGDKFRTISGYIDGEKVTSAYTTCISKNTGKKNSTTAEEQALAEATAMHRKRIERGSFENIQDIDNPIHFKPMLAHDYNDYKDNIKGALFTQPKLDGIRCIIKADGMWSRNGKEILSAPHIFKSLEHLFITNPDLILDGELFAEREVCDFNTIISCVRKTKPTLPDLMLSAEYIQYWVYDVPSVDANFLERFKYLLDLELPSTCVKVPTIAISQSEVEKKLSEYIESGYEGQILRLDLPYENKRSKSLLKHKNFIDKEFEIIGYEEGKGNLKGKIGKLKFRTKEEVYFDAAVNGTHEYLEELWKLKDTLIGKQATVKYFELTATGVDEDGYVIKGGVPRFPKVIAIRDYE
jgi:DNA ligase-1